LEPKPHILVPVGRLVVEVLVFIVAYCDFMYFI